jgi:hypothetical protein
VVDAIHPTIFNDRRRAVLNASDIRPACDVRSVQDTEAAFAHHQRARSLYHTAEPHPTWLLNLLNHTADPLMEEEA